MKIINRSRSLKAAGFLAALLISILTVRAGLLFFHDYKLLVFEKKDQSSWIAIAETAQVDYQSCQKDLSEAKAQKETALRAGNEDLYK